MSLAQSSQQSSQIRPSLHLVRVEDAPVEWIWAEKWVRAALDRDSDLSIEDVRHDVLAGNMQLWLLDHGSLGAVVTQCVDGMNGRICLIVTAGGSSLVRGKLVLGDIEDWAKEQMCCKFIRVIGRKGWRRALPDYEQTGVVMTKRLDR